MVILFVTACAPLNKFLNTLNIFVDRFTGDTVTTFTENCSYSEPYFCSDFKVIKGNSGYLYAGYEGDHWRYLDTILLKIDGETDYIRLSGDFKGHVLDNGKVKEVLTVKD